ncbi:MAG: tetratricopeptide repeat protein [Limnospira sp. PMC 1291.21]|uniref:Tetratricopeptide repeat protein n=1 Tax=Limnospira fusiformis PMC 851.14 TaxID=2219512 RepID=A0ABU9EQA8_LIMFS|nr:MULTISPECIES: tetratricopeptide repeat protein [Limnospira]EKD10178.1 tetratricopeptide TPR_2 repeat protein [Arthrospira platensis C1]MDY7053090.1 tetratricopeptide repeat protein [Limnospira fusiformis LS22]QJB28599.1 tetratricopeptide repeat protein [Limnospira fusiformis SAG 85.79]MDT9177287.1 tetratricopeptide repeat protein [Limnospira sp. PMC 1238.20]MDT9187453.1 tetratricopeptide repeat protein [Limnospira sp. PMC 894.15]
MPTNAIALCKSVVVLTTIVLTQAVPPSVVARSSQEVVSQITATEFFERGVARYQRGDKQGAIADFTQAIRLNRNHALAYYNRGVVRFRIGNNLTEAIADFTQAIRINPEYVDAYYNRAIARVKVQQYWPAIDDVTQVISLDPSHDRAFYLRGLIYSENLKDYQTGINDFTEAIRLNPRNPAPYFKRGNARYRIGDRERAIDDYNKAIDINPSDPEPYYNRAISRYQIGDRQGAIFDLQKSADLYLDLGNFEKYQKAIDTLEKFEN